MRRAVLFRIILLPLMVALGVTIVPVRAEEPYEEEFYGSWECDWDFTETNGGWHQRAFPGSDSQVGAMWVSGEGWRNNPVGASNHPSRRTLEMHRVAEGDSQVQWFRFEINLTHNNMRFGVSGNNADPSGSPWRSVYSGEHVVSYEDEDTNWLYFGMGSWDGPNLEDYRVVRGTVRGFGTPPCTNPTAWSADYTQPLAEYGDLGMFENSEATQPPLTQHNPSHSVFAFSPAPGAPVSAAISGTVIRVRGITDLDCAKFLGLAHWSSGFGVIARKSCDISFVSDGWLFPFRIEPADFNPIGRKARLVTIRGTNNLGDEVDAHYLLDNPYVQEGDEVEAGCWIGETMRLVNPMPSFEDLRAAVSAGTSGVGGSISVAIVQAVANQGLTVVHVDTGEESVVDQFTIAPPNHDVCGNKYPYEGCSGDSALQHPGDWQFSDGIAWRNPGVTLWPGQSITRLDNLTESRLPGVTVIADSAGASRLSVTLGQTSRAFDTGGPPREYVIPHGAQPDSGSTYTIRLENSGSQPINVNYVCVSYGLDDGGQPIIPDPGTRPDEGSSVCYFVNHSFSNRTHGWSTSNVHGASMGEVIMTPLSSVISQPVSLPPGTYTIRARVSIVTLGIWGDDVQDEDQEVGVEYAWPDTTWSEIGSEFVGSYARSNYTLDLSRVFSVEGGAASGDFSFRVTNTGGVQSQYPVTTIALRSVCLENGDTTTGEPPDLWPDDPTTPNPGIFPEHCEAVPMPGGNHIGEWTVYHWHNLKQFFQCDLMVLLNRLYRVVNGIGRYIPALAEHYGEWMDQQLFPWAEGHLYNMAGGTVVIDEGETCSGIWCVLGKFLDLLVGIIERILATILDLVLGVLGMISSLLFNILERLVEVLFFLINEMAKLFIRAMNLLIGFREQWDGAEPTDLGWVPMCDVNPKGSGLCIALWTMEHTIFSGWGRFLIPLLIGYASIMMLLWLYEEIKRMIEKTARAL